MSDHQFDVEQFEKRMADQRAVAAFETCGCMRTRAESTRRQYVTSVERQLAGRPALHSTDLSAKAAWEAHQRNCVRQEVDPQAVEDASRREARARARREHRRERGAALSPEEYAGLVELLKGRCEICGRKTILHVDHLHGSEMFRGLLCRSCNPGLGFFRDKPSLLLQAAVYLLDRNQTPAGAVVEALEKLTTALKSADL